MWEFGLYNPTAQKNTIIFSYTLIDAFRRHPKLDQEEWICWYEEYID